MMCKSIALWNNTKKGHCFGLRSGFVVCESSCFALASLVFWVAWFALGSNHAAPIIQRALNVEALIFDLSAFCRIGGTIIHGNNKKPVEGK